MEAGQVDADLGGGVLKLRVARAGRGKSGGYRTMVLFRRGWRAVFVYGFAKRDRANIDAAELTQFRAAARHVLGLSEAEVKALVVGGDFFEVSGDGAEVQE